MGFKKGEASLPPKLARLQRSNDITKEGKWDGTGMAVCLFYLSMQYFALRQPGFSLVRLPFVKTTLCLFKANVNFRKFLQRTVTALSTA